MEQGPNTPAWKLKHKLIVQSIIKNNDFDLNKINEEVQQILGREGKENG